METTKLFNQAIDFQKAAFNTAYATMTRMQEQMGESTLEYLKKTPFWTDQGLQACDMWSGMVKKNQEEFKRLMDEGFTMVQGIVNAPFDLNKANK